MQGTVLIIDDNENFALFLKRLIGAEGFDTAVAHDAVAARKVIARIYPDVVLMDIRLPDADGVELMKELKDSYPGSQFIMMTAFGSIQSAIESMRLGALDYLTKPFEEEELLVLLQSAMARSAINEEVNRLRSKAPDFTASWEEGWPKYPSITMRKLLAEVSNMAKSDGNLLLTGDSGVGKNYMARWIHKLSGRAGGPFFDISCTALTPSLIESELFGHEPGAFTGSKGRKRGLVELADGGSLFLDEIGDMDQTLQSKLLTFLDTHTLRRIGGERTIEVDARIIVATNRDLEALVEEGRFRKDLYYRLNVLEIRLPPPRERREDIPVLVKELCKSLGREMGFSQPPQVTEEVLEKLMAHDWPGNIRELRNVLERAIILSADKLTIAEVPVHAEKNGPRLADSGKGKAFEVPFPEAGISLKNMLSELTRKVISEAILRSKTRNEAARLLGISRYSLAHYIKTLNIDVRKPHNE
jgi:DNA-binding NtrC family response regulator